MAGGELRLDLLRRDPLLGHQHEHMVAEVRDLIDRLAPILGLGRDDDLGALLCLSTEDLLVKVWGYETEADVGIVWVYLSYLRKRLTALGSTVEIKVRRGVGYTLEAGK